MHELHLVKDLLADVLRLAAKEKARTVVRVTVALGGLTEMDPETLRAHFAEFARGTAAEKAELKIERSDRRELRLVSFDCE